ncbi:unnamed protein product [Blepharisma stoltei]|uniref:Uncharacterized protein n=1 Tax=Blepharisma stoltei TaxID=1481888 RepID=A0AAU9JIK5_9CILI|nr:unnamed protein product [Blepharisma stoltei]
MGFLFKKRMPYSYSFRNSLSSIKESMHRIKFSQKFQNSHILSSNFSKKLTIRLEMNSHMGLIQLEIWSCFKLVIDSFSEFQLDGLIYL